MLVLSLFQEISQRSIPTLAWLFAFLPHIVYTNSANERKGASYGYYLFTGRRPDPGPRHRDGAGNARAHCRSGRHPAGRPGSAGPGMLRFTDFGHQPAGWQRSGTAAPAAGRGQQHAGHPADSQRPRIRRSHRAGSRSRRLYHQALFPGGAAGAGSSPAAAPGTACRRCSNNGPLCL